VKAAVLPLIAKDSGMVEKARALHEELRSAQVVEYDEGGAIGRRYRRQDEIGTPFAFTVDEQTLEDDTVTIRERDSLAQERVAIAKVASRLLDELRKPWTTPKAD
jgi:glycyl-tRNA synthetase